MESDKSKMNKTSTRTAYLGEPSDGVLACVLGKICDQKHDGDPTECMCACRCDCLCACYPPPRDCSSSDVLGEPISKGNTKKTRRSEFGDIDQILSSLNLED